jgi:hypothetical protein
MGFLGSFVYLSQAQIESAKANKSVAGLGLGNSWTTQPVLYSSYHNHGTPEYTYSLVEGINLREALVALGADVVSGSVAMEATATDSYSAIIGDIFGRTASRNYIAPNGTVGNAVDPMLVFYAAQETTALHPDPGVVLPSRTEVIADSNPLFVYGQKEALESNNCTFIKNTCKIRAGLDRPALAVTQNGTTKSISLSDVALLGIYKTSYSWQDGGGYITQSVVGVPLTEALSRMGFTVSSGQALVVSVDSGAGIVSSSRTIGYDELSRCFVAYDAFESGRRVTGSVQPVRVYCPGETRSSVVIDDVVAFAVGAAGSWTDVSESVLAGYGVTGIQVSHISSGYDDGTFRPDQSSNRAQFVKMADAAFAIVQTNPSTATFADVPRDHFYYGYVEGAYGAGLVDGIGGGLFGPALTINREQALAIIARQVASEQGFTLSSLTATQISAALATFGDAASVSPSLRDEMAYAVIEGITKGNSAGNLAPKNPISRIAAATLLIRAQTN